MLPGAILFKPFTNTLSNTAAGARGSRWSCRLLREGKALARCEPQSNGVHDGGADEAHSSKHDEQVHASSAGWSR